MRLLIAFLLVLIFSGSNTIHNASKVAAETAPEDVHMDSKYPVLDNSPEYWNIREGINFEVAEEVVFDQEQISESVKVADNFTWALQAVQGNCNASSVDLENAEDITRVITSAAISKEIALSKARTFLQGQTGCPWDKGYLIREIMRLQNAYPQNNQILVLLKHLASGLKADLKNGGYDFSNRYMSQSDFSSLENVPTEAPLYFFALSKIALLQGDVNSANTWMTHYADWQLFSHPTTSSKPNPQLAYEIYKNIGSKEDLERAALSSGDQVLLMYLHGDYQNYCGCYLRSAYLASDRDLAINWYLVAGLNDEQINERFTSLSNASIR